MAKVALLPKKNQEPRTAISSFRFQNITFVAGEPAQEVSTQVGVMYMTDPNMVVEFTESDFKDLDLELQGRMAERLNVAVKDVKTTVLPKKTVASKVKTTLTGVKSKPKVVEEKKVEEPSEEEPSDD